MNTHPSSRIFRIVVGPVMSPSTISTVKDGSSPFSPPASFFAFFVLCWLRWSETLYLILVAGFVAA